MRSCWWVAVFGLGACKSDKASLDGTAGEGGTDPPVETAEDIADLCAESDPIEVTLTVTFPATEPGCDWGVDGNLEMENGVITARVEQVESIPLPDEVVVCDMVFNFDGVSGGEGTPMYYDDKFLFAFNDIVLSASYAPMIDELEHDDILATYDWAALRGYPIEFDDSIPTYCVGEATGQADCTIPPPETNGVMALAFDPSIDNRLALIAIQEQRFDFNFITMGDNDPDRDCYHDEFAFTVTVPYVRP